MTVVLDIMQIISGG